MAPTPEEQLAFVTENSRLVAEMGKILDVASAQDLIRMSENIAALKKPWEDYNKNTEKNYEYT